MKKIEKNDWFTTGLSILESDGFSKITIDNLCLKLNVTKGSFYHHFGNIDGYIDALMKYWKQENTITLIEKADQFANVPDKIEALNKMVFSRSHKSEQVIRGWSFSNEIVRKYVAEIDNMRISYNTNLNISTGENRETAKQKAILEYACLIGIQQLFPQLTMKKQKELYKLFKSKT